MDAEAVERTRVAIQGSKQKTDESVKRGGLIIQMLENIKVLSEDLQTAHHYLATLLDAPDLNATSLATFEAAQQNALAFELVPVSVSVDDINAINESWESTLGNHSEQDEDSAGALLEMGKMTLASLALKRASAMDSVRESCLAFAVASEAPKEVIAELRKGKGVNFAPSDDAKKGNSTNNKEDDDNSSDSSSSSSSSGDSSDEEKVTRTPDKAKEPAELPARERKTTAGRGKGRVMLPSRARASRSDDSSSTPTAAPPVGRTSPGRQQSPRSSAGGGGGGGRMSPRRVSNKKSSLGRSAATSLKLGDSGGSGGGGRPSMPSISPRRGRAETTDGDDELMSVLDAQEALVMMSTDTAMTWSNVAGDPLRVLVESPANLTLDKKVFKFEVMQKGKVGKVGQRAMTVDLDRGCISSYSPKTQSLQSRQLTKLAKATRSSQDPRKAKLWWVPDDGSYLTCERYRFLDATQREMFLEAVWRCRSQQSCITSNDIKVFVGTWNLGEAEPDEVIKGWLQPGKFDIYVLNFQEANYELERGNAETHLFNLVAQNLGGEYLRLVAFSLLHIRMCLFVHKQHWHKISNLHKGVLATGIGNIIGNKGGIGITFNFNETSLCFIGCHLAARMERLEQRCTNVKQIINGLDLATDAPYRLDTWYDHVFWTGDLNYRIDHERAETIEMIEAGDLMGLLSFDQLKNAQANGQVFPYWKEPAIAFIPTYRFDRGSMVWSEEKMRNPSYCDRVLFKHRAGTEAQTLCDVYDAHHGLMTSDHHPVYAGFTVPTLMPNLPHRRLGCLIEVTQLRGENFDFAEDKYQGTLVISFTGKCLEKAVATKGLPLKNRDALAWEGTTQLRPIFSNVDYLRLSHVLVSVKDGKCEIGQGSFSLTDGCDSAEAVEFSVALVNNGLAAGYVRGQIRVQWENDKTEDELPDGVLRQAFLLKQGAKVKSWKRRWFILKADGELTYFANKNNLKKPLGKLTVEPGAVSEYSDAGKANCIAIQTERRRLLFCADDREEFSQWIKALSKVGL